MRCLLRAKGVVSLTVEEVARSAFLFHYAGSFDMTLSKFKKRKIKEKDNSDTRYVQVDTESTTSYKGSPPPLKQPSEFLHPKEEKEDWVPKYLWYVGWMSLGLPVLAAFVLASMTGSGAFYLYMPMGVPAAGIFFALARLVERSES